MKFQLYLILILTFLFSLSTYGQCPTTVISGFADIIGPVCEDDIFDLEDLVLNVETDDNANTTLTWFLQDGTPVPDPNNVLMSIGGNLCQPTTVIFELKVTCPNDPAVLLDAGTFTANIYPTNSLQVCTPTILQNDQCNPVVDLLCPMCDLVVEYFVDGAFTLTPPELVPGSMGNGIQFKVYLNGSTCFFNSSITVDCPDDCPMMILIPPTGIAPQPGFHCSGDIMNLEALQVGVTDLSDPAFSVAVWKDSNGNVIDDPAAVPILHPGTSCVAEILTFTLEFDCTLDENLDVFAGTYQATVYPDLEDLVTLPSGCNTEITTICPGGLIEILYSVGGAPFSTTAPATLTDNDPALTVDYQVNIPMPAIDCNISDSFTADCANAGMCTIGITPINEPFNVVGSIAFSLDGLNANATADPNAVFIWTDENGMVVNDIDGNAQISYDGDGCSPVNQTWNLEIGCINDPAFSMNGGTLSVTVFPNIEEDNIVLPDFCDTEISYNCASLQDIVIEYSTDGTNFTNIAPPGLNEGDAGFELFYNIYVNGAPAVGTYQNSIMVTCPIDIPDCESAGTATPAKLCNDGSVINLFDLLEGEDSTGTWLETSAVPSAVQAFDDETGIFNTSGQLPQVYEFEYMVIVQDCPIETATVSIELIDGPNVSVTSEVLACNDGGDPSSIDFAELILEDEGDNFWMDNNGMNLVFDTDSNSVSNSVIDFTGFEAGEYVFTYAPNDSTLCVGEGQSTTVTVENCLGKVVVPTAFSPNNDGINDLLRIRNIEGVESVEFKVFNRWGQMVFNAIDVNDGWDGTFKREPQGIGVYVFFAEVIYKNMEVETVTGSVTLIR